MYFTKLFNTNNTLKTKSNLTNKNIEIMKLPIRLENAITKLYTAFHSGTLDAFDCHACAVGNLLDNDGSWLYSLNGIIGERKFTNQQLQLSGYSNKELNVVELKFMRGTDGLNQEYKHSHQINNPDKETQFKGLCAVVEYLCELDNIPNVMDYTKLFETENDQPKYELKIN